jgi:hypothetical protein
MNVKERPSSRTDTAQEPVATHEVGDGETVAQAVVAAVSFASEVDERDLEPLYGTVDPDALDAIFGPLRDDRSLQREGWVAFAYEGHDVCIGSDRTIRVY